MAMVTQRRFGKQQSGVLNPMAGRVARLHAIEVPYPFARDDNNQEQPGSTSTAENRDYLKREVE